MHNLLKFGPNEQIVMRSKTLSRSQREKYNALLNQKDILIERVFHSEKNTKIDQPGFKKLEIIDNKLQGFSFSKPNWDKAFLTVSQLETDLKANVQLFDFRHNKVENEIELFSFIKGRTEKIHIKNAEKIRENAKILRNKIIDIDPTYYIEARYLFKTLIKPYLYKTSKKIFISPHSFLYDIPFDALVIAQDTENAQISDNLNVIRQRGLTAQKLKKSSTTNAIHFGQKFEVSLLSGIRNFKRLQDNKDYTFVGIGDPVFKGNTKAKQVSFNSYAMSPNVNRGSIDALVRLPGTKLELETISKSNLLPQVLCIWIKMLPRKLLNRAFRSRKQPLFLLQRMAWLVEN